MDHQGAEEKRHFWILFINDEEDIPSEQAAALHATSTVPKGELDYMRILYQLGFEKAVILQILHISEDFIEVTFCQYKGTLQESPGCNRIQKPWPPPQSVKPIGFMTPLLSHDPQPACHLQLGLTAEELNQFFNASAGPELLCRITDGVDLSLVTQEALNKLRIRPSCDLHRRLVAISSPPH